MDYIYMIYILLCMIVAYSGVQLIYNIKIWQKVESLENDVLLLKQRKVKKDV